MGIGGAEFGVNGVGREVGMDDDFLKVVKAGGVVESGGGRLGCWELS